MISDSELQSLRRFIAAQREREVSSLDSLWAGRCAALLEQRQRLEKRLQVLSREVDALLEGRGRGTSENDTWVV
jgi:hypothetical protein